MTKEATEDEWERRRRPSRDPESDRERRRDATQRRRRSRRATDSTGEALPKSIHKVSPYYGYTSDSSPHRKKRDGIGRSSSSNPLSLDSLAALDAQNAKKGWKGYDEAYLQEVRQKESRMERDRWKEERSADRERRKAERRALREERRQVHDGEKEQVLEAQRLRALEDEREKRREQRREEKRRQKRIERERERQLELERQQREQEEMERQEQRARVKELHRQSHTSGRTALLAANSGEDEDAEFEESADRSIDEGQRVRTKHHAKSDRLYREKAKSNSYQHERNTPHEKITRRLVSGPLLEEGGNKKQHAQRKDKYENSSSEYTTDSEWKKKRNRRICIYISVFVAILAIIIPVAVVLSSKKSSSNVKSAASASTSKPANSNLNGVSEDTIPAGAKGTYLDPFSWYDTADFNVTYTDATVGGLPVMGLNSTWDDSAQANPNVPALKDSFPYGKMPIRGMNIGGWLSIEPFITPSFFAHFSTSGGVVDEYTLTSKLGSTKAAQTLEQHYSAFVNAQTFADIRAAGFDHVRIPFSYWAVTTYEGDPYVKQTSFRYLLRGIEWARQNGLRVNLDLHGLPGSQNGWNHSGRQGYIGWLNGTDGDLNGKRSLDIHDQLSQFFGQPRYKNIITMYGLVNEPRMTGLDTSKVLSWTESAISIVRKNNLSAVIVFGDGFMGLDKWQGRLQDQSNLLLDVHQYVIFNSDQITLDHSDKITFACKGWSQQMQRSMNTATGFGPTMCGEWSQADTDCAQYLNNVGVGSRWEGTMNTGNSTTSVLSPQCPTHNNPTCDCSNANADPSKYSDAYKQWLLLFALAQMDSFERGWGWFYWTWQTESAVQWSWKLGAKAGILPKTALAADRTFTCNNSIPDFAGMGLAENY